MQVRFGNQDNYDNVRRNIQRVQRSPHSINASVILPNVGECDLTGKRPEQKSRFRRSYFEFVPGSRSHHPLFEPIGWKETVIQVPDKATRPEEVRIKLHLWSKVAKGLSRADRKLLEQKLAAIALELKDHFRQSIYSWQQSAFLRRMKGQSTFYVQQDVHGNPKSNSDCIEYFPKTNRLRFYLFEDKMCYEIGLDAENGRVMDARRGRYKTKKMASGQTVREIQESAPIDKADAAEILKFYYTQHTDVFAPKAIERGKPEQSEPAAAAASAPVVVSPQAEIDAETERRAPAPQEPPRPAQAPHSGQPSPAPRVAMPSPAPQANPRRGFIISGGQRPPQEETASRSARPPAPPEQSPPASHHSVAKPSEAEPGPFFMDEAAEREQQLALRIQELFNQAGPYADDPKIRDHVVAILDYIEEKGLFDGLTPEIEERVQALSGRIWMNQQGF